MPAVTLDQAVSRFGAAAKGKLSGRGATGAPEDQLRSPLEGLLSDLAELALFRPGDVVAVGEATLAELRTRPDYAVTVRGALVGFIELKAPGKGADPRRFKDEHDKGQWERLRSLPNLLYTDGNAFSLWRGGKLVGEVVRLTGDVETSGAALAAPPALERLVADFLRWEPVAPTSARALAEVSAQLCRFLRDEVTEQLGLGTPALTGLAEDWRRLLFPDATDEEFADGYAQAVTFGLLMARAQGIRLDDGLDRVAKALARTSTVIGSAFRVLTDDVEGQSALKTSLGTLTRVLGVVDWAAIGKGDPEAWLYFYEHFLEAYDNDLRKQTGSYYTPPEVVTAMVRLVDEALCDPARFGVAGGLASDEVTLADPAVGTGTYLLGVLRRIAETARADGAGAVPGVVRAALQRVIGFELQFGPFAVAQLRLLAEVADLLKVKGTVPEDLRLRLYVTDTLGNPDEEAEYIPQILRPLAESRRQANAVKRAEPITVVIGNPPYKEKAMGRGGWVEAGSANVAAPLDRWQPPREWSVGAHAKHLRNLYVYFWRWATWKVFGDAAGTAGPRKGIVCFITVAGFLNGPGFQRMREDLRQTADEIWVVDCSPEGHQPAVASRVFQGVQQPVCIVLAARTGRRGPAPARVRYRALPVGRREGKFAALAALSLDGEGWTDCPEEGRAPFLPAPAAGWTSYPALDDLFLYNGSGVMPGRTWVIAPDRASLEARWQRLVAEGDPARKEVLFHPHGSDGELGDRHTGKVLAAGLPGHEHRAVSVGKDKASVVPPIRYAFRSFDRQWIIPDNRLLNRPNPTLWEGHSGRQIYLTAPHDRTPTNGPALTFAAAVPDLHHYNGRGGRAFPLWADAAATTPNVPTGLLALLAEALGAPVSPEDLMVYLAAVAAHPGYVARFAADLVQPGLRIPLTAEPALFAEAAVLGREVLWLHTFGERCADPTAGRPASPPRLPAGERPLIPEDGAIPEAPDAMPDEIAYDPAARRLRIGTGHVDNVPPEVWAYEVSGKQVLPQWFSYRGRDRSRPLIGDRRPPSPLGDIGPGRWLAEYTAELLNLLNVLGLLVRLEARQTDLLARICAGKLISAAQVKAARNAQPAPPRRAARREARQGDLLV
ncbi:type ISP restriction/modification enzyme [Falsiroseomonas ponticola]|uniref:type ISP restriction/modification enzyme n=1 Tax=Falsiroseomonas ponticola TaxID=2786951 RepID=UPI001931D44B|nr:type ISP restriction/modification enzyme [Roseomonas ponticola]